MTIRWPITLIGVLTGLLGFAGPATADPLPVKYAETGSTVMISGVAGADVKIKRSFRLALTRAAALPVHFVAPILTDKFGRRIDPSQVHIPDGSLTVNPTDYAIEINGAIRPGSYDGTIEVRSSELPNGLLQLPVHLEAAASTTFNLSKDTPRIAITRASSCDPLTTALLTSLLCRSAYGYDLSGTLPPGSGKQDLLLVDSQGAALPALSTTATVDGTRLTIGIDDGALWPGHYTGRVRLNSQTWDAPVDVPFDLQVRTTAWFPIIAIILGILLGRLQAYMTSKGDALLAAAARLREVLARASLLDQSMIDAVDSVAALVWSAIKSGNSARAAALLDPLDTNVGVLEKVKGLQASATFDAAANTLVSQIIASCRISDATTVQSDFATLEAQVAQLIAKANAAGGGGGEQPNPTTISGIREMFTSGQLNLARVVRPIMRIGLVVAIAGSGIKLLYIDGSPTLGAQPLADFLALFAWGLTADVAGTTLAGIRGLKS